MSIVEVKCAKCGEPLKVDMDQITCGPCAAKVDAIQTAVGETSGEYIGIPVADMEPLLSAYESYIVMSCEPGDNRSYMRDVVDAAAELIRSMPALVQAHGGPLAEHFKEK